MRAEIDRIVGFSTAFPGSEALSLRVGPGEETGLVTLAGSVPVRGLPAITRLNLFSEISGVRDHIASAILTPGNSGTLITVSGILADSWHVYAQCSDARQDVRLVLASQPCCAPQRVRVRQDLLSLGIVGEGAALIAPDLRDPPLVPWGEEYGLHQTFYRTGGGSFVLPLGSRVWHWTALGIDATSTVTWTTSVGTSQVIPVPPGPGAGGGGIWPQGQLSAVSVSWFNVQDFWFEVIR
jgi:hypothetical protein